MSADNTNKLPPISTFSHEDEDHQKPLGFKPTLLTVPSSQNYNTSSQYPYATSPNTSSEHLPSLASPYYYSQSVTSSSGLNGPGPTTRRSPSPYYEKHNGSLASDGNASKQTDFLK